MSYNGWRKWLFPTRTDWLCEELGWWKGDHFPASLLELLFTSLVEVTTLLLLTSARGIHPGVRVAAISGEESQGDCKSSSVLANEVLFPRSGLRATEHGRFHRGMWTGHGRQVRSKTSSAASFHPCPQQTTLQSTQLLPRHRDFGTTESCTTWDVTQTAGTLPSPSHRVMFKG